jgi:hypothetical protein
MGGLFFAWLRALCKRRDITNILAPSRYAPSFFIKRDMTVGALRKTDSCDAHVYRSTSMPSVNWLPFLNAVRGTNHGSVYARPS